MDELNEKLALWVGFKRLPQGKRGFHYEQGQKVMDWMPPGDYEWYHSKLSVPNFTDSLDECFEWLVPSLRVDNKYPYLTEIILDPTICETDMWYCYLRYKVLHEDGFIEEEEAQGSATTEALAFCKAVEKLID